MQSLRSPVRGQSAAETHFPTGPKSSLINFCSKKIPLAGIARVCEVSESWLQNYVTADMKRFPGKSVSLPNPKGPLRIQCDEMWSFVNDKGNKQWIWLAQDVRTREIVGVHVGDRSGQEARKLWESLPAVYRQCAVAYTDFWDAYALVFPQKRHKAVGKGNWQNQLYRAVQLYDAANECLAWFVRHSHFLKNSRIILRPFGCLYITTTHPYLSRLPTYQIFYIILLRNFNS